MLSAYWAVSNNFGDLIGPWMIEKMTGLYPLYAEPNAQYSYLCLGGSIINHVNSSAEVWGAGLGTITDGINPDARIHAVRGPISRSRALSLGIKCPPIYGDPGLLLPIFHKPSLKRQPRVGVVPHYVDQYRAYDRYRSSAHVINVFKSIECVVDEICSCSAIISSSLHGIIVAHAYGIPALWVKISDSLGGDGTKFRDYFQSVGMDIPQAIDLREGGPLPEVPNFVPSIDTKAFFDACPIPKEKRVGFQYYV
jgi:pyruvyltransferase